MLIISSIGGRTSGSLEIPGQPSLHGEFQNRYDCIVRPYFIIKRTTYPHKTNTYPGPYLKDYNQGN